MVRPRVTRWIRLRTWLLVGLLLLPGTPDVLSRLHAERAQRERALAALAPGRNVLPRPQERHQQAPPDPSGAYPPYPANSTFDAEIVTLDGAPTNHDFETAGTDLGTPPSNADFASTPTDAGTPPSNFDFATGDFTDWTTAGSPTIQSDTPHGSYAELAAANAAVTTAAFTVDTAAQAFVADIGLLGAGSTILYVYALSGSGYTTSTLLRTLSCTGCQSWEETTFNAAPYLGQSIKLKFLRIGGTIGVDRVRGQVLFPAYAASGILARLLAGSDPYARLGNVTSPISSGVLTSSAFTVESTAQFATVAFQGLSSYTDQAYVKVLSGAGYATSTTMLILTSIPDGGWTTYHFNATAYLGQSIKLKVEVAYGTIGVDDVGGQRIDLPDWTPGGDAVLVAGSPDGSAVKTSGTLTSAPFTIPSDVQQLSFRYRTSDSGGTSVYGELLRGPTFSTVTALTGSPFGGASGTWYTRKVNVTAYAGETVKLRFTPQLQPVYVDDVGIPEQAVPGWTLATTLDAVAIGSDSHGTYLTDETNGGIKLTSGEIDTGIVDTASYVDGRSYVVTYALGPGTGSIVYVWWDNGVETPYLAYYDASNTADGNTVVNGRFTLWDTMGTHGQFTVQISSNGKLYSLADNIARQQLSEPFSQQVGVGVDTSTGSFGHQETDLTIQGGPLPLVFSRYYRGHSDRYGELGARWTHTYDTFLGIYVNGDVSVVFGSGKEEFFAWDTNTQTHKPVDVRVKSTLTLFTNPPDGVDYRYVTKDGLTYNFEGDGDLISIQDANANQITLYRNVDETIASVEDPGGRELVFAYDTNGRLETVTGPDGAEVTYTYDGNGDLTAVDKPADARTEYAYSRHRLTEIKQRQGEDLQSATMVTVLTNTLDAVNRVIAQTDTDDNAIAIAYLTGADQGVTRVTDPFANETDFYFDEWARTTYVDYPGDESKTFVYDDEGNLEKFVDAAARETQFAYDANADPTTLTDPLGNPITVTYTAKHLPLTFTDANEHDWSFTYDLQANVATATDPLDHTWSYTYDAAGNRLTETTPLNRTTTSTYDSANNLLTQTDPLDHTWTWTYDGRGNRLTETDPNDHTTTYDWTLADNLNAIIDATGAEWIYGYDLAGELMIMTDPAASSTFWVYLGIIGQVTAKVDALSQTWDYTYDDAGRMTSETDPLGHVVSYAYDATGKMTSQIVDPNPEGQSGHLDLVTTYAYDEAGRLISETFDPGTGSHLNRTTTYAYDDNGRLTGKELPDGGVWTYAYDAVGNEVAVTDPLDRTTTSTYDAANRLVLVTDPLGHRVKFGYDADNRQTTVVVDPATDPNGNAYAGSHLDLTTTTVYDDADRVTSFTDPAGNVVAYAYDAAGNQTSVTIDPGSSPHLNQTTTFEYDELNRVVATTDPLGREATYAYDSRGRKTAETRGITATDPGIATAYTYDDLGRLLTVTVDPGTSPHLNNVTTYTHDAAGRRTSVTNPKGFTTAFTYDAANRLTEIEDELGGTVSLAYNAAGEVTSLTNPRGKVSTTTYDDLGRVLTATDPLSRTRTNVYDLAGQLTRHTDARGIETNYLYDAMGQVTNVQDESSTDLITYSYDTANRQTGMTDETGSTGWVYDAASRVTSLSSPQGTLAYTYDAAGQRATMTLPGSRTIAYAYDAAGQLSEVTDWQSRTTSFTHTGFGAVETVDRPNGVSSLYEYDAAGRLSAVEHDAISTMLARFAYDVDANGNRSAVAITGSAVTNQTEDYTFDDLDRLLQVDYDDGVNPVETVAYAYDATGNRTSVTSGAQVTTYSYDDADQLTSLSGANSLTFTYDLNGNRIAAGSDTFSYDWRDRLIEAEVDSTTVSYTYSGDDLRATRQVSGSSATPYLWDRLTGLPEVVEDGTVAFIQLDDPGLVAAVDASNAATYPLGDALGSTRLATDGSGSVTATADWDVFGNLRASSGTQSSFGWTGEQRDDDTGLTSLRARDLDPLTGRFLQRDSVSPNAPGSQGYNAYSYAAGNPVTFTDPSGHGLEAAAAALTMLTVYLTLRDVAQILTRLGDIPPMARHLIAAVVIMGIFLLRNLLMLLLMNVAMDASVAGKFLVGRAIMLLQWVRLSRPMQAVFRTCAGTKVGGTPCLRLAGLFPKLPKPPTCLLRGIGEEAVAVGAEAVLAAAGITGETSFGKVDAALAGGGALLECVGSKNGKATKEVAYCSNSFDGATEVLMADGAEKRIDEVNVGDMVWAEDPETGVGGARRVTAVIVGAGLKRLVAVTIATALGLAIVTATDGHPFWVASRAEWVDAVDLKPGDLLLTSQHESVRVASITVFEEQHRVYNLTVDDLHTYFVFAGGEALLTHNRDCLTASEHAARLTKALRNRPSDRVQAHHIVPSTEPEAALARKRLEDLGIDVDSAFNGMWLENTSHDATKKIIYVRIVNEYISNATSASDAIRRLDTIKLIIKETRGKIWTSSRLSQ